ncbi:Putative membrane protein [Sodalis praecaptivus]|uniref:UPF0266 membrane protein Sant_1781 n=1 Tax=Sodalis praecaptivus TaxID=1239307 RepID=W0HSR9_9GAMM|nr:DUF986 family protein [Sodalis praecaptivus]AHF76834.1 Putative membrane protein [Sodalis praecaptivus]
MTVTDIGLVVMIVIALLFAVFDEFIVDYALRGKTRLRVPLRRQGRLDGLIFIVLLLILLYKNITTGGTVVTSTLILILGLMVVYLAYIRRPRMLFKTEGFFYGNVFIRYSRIKNMNLSEDGYLVIDLEKRRLLIQVNKLDDLENIYHFLMELQ